MKKMDNQRYRVSKLILTAILIALISVFVGLGNYWASLIVFAASIVAMIILKSKAKGPFTDERMDSIAGKSAKIVLVVFALAMAAAGIVLVSLRSMGVEYLIIGNILIFLECGMLLLYAILFRYYLKKK